MSTGVEPGAFECLSPSRFVSLTFPNPVADSHHDPLRIAVLDSPIPSPPSSPPTVAAMLVPVDREHDWIFSTAAGHLQLLLSCSSPPLSRLILIGNLTASESDPKPYTRPDPDPEPDSLRRFQNSLLPLLLALSPKSAFLNGGIPKIPFLSYDDDVSRIVSVDRVVGPTVGEMLVEDVEIDREFRRRLRFKRMPNLVQTQVRLVPDLLNFGKFRPETGSLVQPYLGPMVASLSLLVPNFDQLPRALCIGVGGGALLMCLRFHLGFDVLGIEADEVVLSVARRHFGLIEDEFLRVRVGDGIEFAERYWGSEKGHFLGQFHVIMVDLDSVDAVNGISAPPLVFAQKDVLLAVRLALLEKGILVVNVIRKDGPFYNMLIDVFREVFAELYEIDVGNGENYVLIATASPVGCVPTESRGAFSEKLKELHVESFVDCIKKI